MMDILTHTNTHQIKRLSKHLYIVLCALRYILSLGWIGIAIVVFIPVGEYWLGNVNIQIESDNLFLKGVIIVLYSLGLFVALTLNNAFRDLMKQYMNGNIFSDQTINCVNRALKAGMALVALSLTHNIAGAIYTYFYHSEIDISFTPQIIVALIYFSLMYILLWALEIGNDLNDESIKTI